MSGIKVACATSAMSSYYKQWFSDWSVIGHESKVTPDIDLLILTGGSDIHPGRYNERPNGAVGWIMERDEREFNILSEYLRVSKSPKVLGVCRGLQLLNVFFGGSLHQDLDSAGAGHPGLHDIRFYDTEHPMSWLTSVNSLHHQAVRALGYYRFSNGRVVADEPRTGMPEMVVWEPVAFGVQFHPELFSPERGGEFFSIITKWVNGEVSLGAKEEEFRLDEDEEENEEEHDPEEEDNGDVDLGVDFPTVSFSTTSTASIEESFRAFLASQTRGITLNTESRINGAPTTGASEGDENV